jgi:hypothetical protein
MILNILEMQFWVAKVNAKVLIRANRPLHSENKLIIRAHSISSIIYEQI